MKKELPSATKGATSRKKANKKSATRWGLIAASMVSVTPLSPPSGSLFYLDSIYDSPKIDPESFEEVVNKIREEIGLEIPKPEDETSDSYGIHMTSVPVSVASRKLKATWTPSLAEDLSHYPSIDAEAELTALLNQELEKEMVKALKKLNKKKSY